jgi:hypothetical protein
MGDGVLQFHMQHVHLDWRKNSRGSAGMSSVFLSTETVTDALMMYDVSGCRPCRNFIVVTRWT